MDRGRYDFAGRDGCRSVLPGGADLEIGRGLKSHDLGFRY